MTYTVIPEALDYGIKLMDVGETYRFFIPSYLAYGSYSTTDFGPNSNFIVDIEVTGVQSESDIDDIQRDSIAEYVAANYADYQEYASGLYFIDSITGPGDKPFNNSTVNIDFDRKYLDNSVVHSVDGVTVYLDKGMAVQGLEEGIKLTREGGTSILIMPASIGFKQSVCVIPQNAREKLFNDQIINNSVEPYPILKYVVKLTNEGGTSILIMPASIGFKQSVCVIPEKARESLFESQIINNNVKPYSMLKYVVKLKVVNL